jgi:hypothetical protein
MGEAHELDRAPQAYDAAQLRIEALGPKAWPELERLAGGVDQHLEGQAETTDRGEVDAACEDHGQQAPFPAALSNERQDPLEVVAAEPLDVDRQRPSHG